MNAQIIKLNPQQCNIKQVLNKLSKQLQHSNSDITVIVKPNLSSVNNNHNNHVNNQNKRQNNKSSSQLIKQKDPIKNQKESKVQKIKQQSIKYSQMNDNYLYDQQIVQDIQNNIGHHKTNRHQNNVKRGSFSQSLINRKMINNQLQQDYNIFISNNQILPNVLITSKQKETIKLKLDRRSSIDSNTRQNIPVFKINESHKLTQSVTQIKQSTLPIQSGNNQKYTGLQVSQSNSQRIRQSSSSRQTQSDQSNNEEQYNIDQQQSIVQSLFLVQDKLNDAIKFIKHNKLFQLEEYLYQFKAKYSFMSNRVQIKWRLLMAYCKQNRKQFERAAILYQQVLQMTELSPISLLIQAADIHHRLAICYTQIKRWNDGIISFSHALKQYRKSSKKNKYAQCFNNLGTLYLTAEQFAQAEKCFLLSYEIKKKQFSPTSRKLISTLLNLYECNILGHNYEQAENVLKQIQLIVIALKQTDMLNAGLLRRRGKLSFLKGNIKKAQQYYGRALHILQQKYPYSLQYAQLCHNLAIIKLEQEQINEAKQLLNTTLSRFNFYYSKDSFAIRNVKETLELLQKLSLKLQNTQVNNNALSVFQHQDTIKQKCI